MRTQWTNPHQALIDAYWALDNAAHAIAHDMAAAAQAGEPARSTRADFEAVTRYMVDIDILLGRTGKPGEPSEPLEDLRQRIWHANRVED